MVHKKNFVVVIRSKGKILREFEYNKVYIPFGSEYEIVLKNLNSVDAVASISIDGIDVMDGKKLIVEANSDASIERYVKSSMNKGNKFKFIEKTDQISSYRDDKIEDGIVRVEYQFEKQQTCYSYDDPYFYDSYYNRKMYKPTSKPLHPIKPTSALGSIPTCSTNSDLSTIGNVTDDYYMNSINDLGITVPGSISKQKFSYGSIGELERSKYVISISLLGEIGQEKVISPIPSRKKIECVTCGKKNKVGTNYCPRCGTSVIILD